MVCCCDPCTLSTCTRNGTHPCGEHSIVQQSKQFPHCCGGMWRLRLVLPVDQLSDVAQAAGGFLHVLASRMVSKWVIT